jgi:hypothetical protein
LRYVGIDDGTERAIEFLDKTSGDAGDEPNALQMLVETRRRCTEAIRPVPDRGQLALATLLQARQTSAIHDVII